MISLHEGRGPVSASERMTQSSAQANFLVNVRRELAARGWSQAELARALEVSPSQLSQLFSGYRNPGLKTIESIGEILGLHAAELLMPADCSDELKRLMREALASATSISG
jgi:transcriptional regulator with XRE-family HTH domain